MITIRRLSQLLLITVSLVSVCSLCGYLFGRSDELWKNYTVVIVPEDSSSEIIQNLRQNGFDDLLSFETAEISLSSINKVNRIKLSALSDYLEPTDPRMDPFMRAVNSYFFTGDSYQIIYLKGKFNLFILNWRFNKILKEYEGWVIPGVKSYRNGLLPVFFFFVYLIFLLILGERRFFFLFLSSVSAFLLILNYNWLVLPFCFFVSYFCLFVIPPLVNDRLKNAPFRWISAAVFFLVFVTYQIYVLKDAIPVILFISAGVIPAFHRDNKIPPGYKKRSFDHKLFEPVLIADESYRRLKDQIKKAQYADRHRISADLSLFLIILLVAAGAFSQNRYIPEAENYYTLPVIADKKSQAGMTYDNFKKLFFMTDKDYPDISDCLAHEIYQKNFIYNISYGIPFSKRELTLSTFSDNNGIISQQSRIMQDFDDELIQEYLDNLKDDNIGDLFLSQGTVSPVIKKIISRKIDIVHFNIYFYFPLFLCFCFVFLLNKRRQNKMMNSTEF